MKRTIVFAALLALALTLSAQGVRQSTEISNLVYGKKQPVEKTKEQLKAEKKAKKEAEKAAKKAKKEAEKAAKKEAKRQAELRKNAGKNPIPQPQKVVEPVKPKPQEPVVQKPVEPKPAPKVEEPKPGPRTITKVVRRRVKRADGTYATHKVMRTKVYKGMKKTRGFRVQVFSGGNTREDRLKAERAGAKVKADFPEQPVYVHFYSPRWMCLFGNFTRRQDANTFMKRAKSNGFQQANVIQTMVTVRNAIK
jgi:hypothetical protein